MRIIFLGAPGVGKGTQAQQLRAEFGWAVVATGDLLREAMAQGTPLGLQAKTYIERGDLVPDEVVNGLVRERLQNLSEGFILDGYPRTVAQAEYLDRLLQELSKPLDAVIEFDVSEDEIVERLGGRRICPRCGAIYHVKANPSRSGDQCERCNTTLVIRADDQPETIRRRLAVYREQTQPLIEYYARRGLLARVSADDAPEIVYQALRKTLNL